jgi:hypothetical protein
LSDDKYYVEPYKVYLNLVWLSQQVGNGGGDVAGGAEFPPTDADVAILAGLEKELAAAQAGFKQLMDVDLPAFNKLMAGRLTIADR